MSSRASSKSFKHVAGGQVFDTPSRLLASREVSQLRIRVPVESARNGDERRSSTAGSANLRIVPLSLLSCLPNFQFAICNGVPVLCQLDFHRSNRLRRVPRFLKSITSASLPCRASAGICVCHQLQRVAPAAERPAKLDCNPLQNLQLGNSRDPLDAKTAARSSRPKRRHRGCYVMSGPEDLRPRP
jgi:hypothetical protein